MGSPRPDDLTLLYSRQDIQRRVRELAGEIRRDYAGRQVVVVGVLKGAFMFMADLVRELDLDVRLSFISVSSYGAGTESSGDPVIRESATAPLADADVLIVEDILDTGISMTALVDYVRARSPRSIRVCVLIDKRSRRTEKVSADYVGFELADGFVVGYGIDYAGKYRDLPEVFRIGTDS